MRCEEARRLMGADKPGRELMEHIAGCPACARQAEAAQVLERLLAQSKSEPPPIPSFEAVRDRVNMISTQQSTGEKIMSQIKDQFQTRPRLIAALGLTLSAFIIAVLVPFSSAQTVGWKISLDGIDASATPSPTLLNAAFATAGLHDMYVETITENNEGGTVEELYVNTPSKKEAQQLAQAITSSLAREYAQVDIQPVIRAKSSSLIAQIYEKSKVHDDPPVRVRFEEGLLLINGKGVFETFKSPTLSDDEVRQQVLNIFALEKDKKAEVAVDVETSEDGRTRIIQIQAPSASLSHALSDIELDASDRLVAVKYKGDGDIPDSVKAIELSIGDTLTTQGIKMKIVIDMDEK